MGPIGMPELIVIAMAAILLVVPLAFGVGLAIYLVRRNQVPPTPLPPPPLPQEKKSP